MKFLLALAIAPLSFAGLKVATYNVGLAPTYVHMSKERRPHLIKALTGSPADILCLQEVWGKEDRDLILKALKTSHPHQYVTPIKNIRSKNRPACLPWHLFGKGKFVGCMRKNCGGLEGDKFTSCIINTCGPALQRLKQQNRECATSLMAQVGKSSLHALLTVFNPFVKAGIFTYEGSNGLMLLSKYPLLERRLFDMTSISTLTNRGALMAKADVQGKEYQIVCTHLSADLSKEAPYTGEFSNWGEENKGQFSKLLKEVSAHTTPTIVMGDFNCGLGNSKFSIDPQLEDSCRLAPEAGFIDHLAINDLGCTFCSGSLNNLNKGRPENYLIDHIYVRGVSVASSQIIFKEKITIMTREKKKYITNLSDHFGVMAELK